MNSRTSVLRRMTICVAASALASALILIGSGWPAANAGTEGTPAWRQAIAALAVPGQGCFTASFPALQWRSTTCSRVHPKVPQQFAGTKPNQENARGGAQQVGGCSDNSCDYAAQTAAPMTEADGSFPGVTCAASPCESGRFGNVGAVTPTVYSLQLNTNYNLPATTSCSTAAIPADCTGWQQFVYDSYLKEIQVEPALVGYDKPCAAPFNASDGAGNCYDENENTAPVPLLTPQQLKSDSVKFSGQVGLVGGTLTDTVTLTVSGTAYAATAPDSLVNLSGNWKDAQFGLYGDRGGAKANFVAGTDLQVSLATHSGTTAAPQCVAFNSTGESNNLFLQPAPTLGTVPSPTIESDQNSTQPTSPAACATGNGWGEIHLNTFGCASCSTHLSYNFQATGDFQLAAAPVPGGPPFNVQARLVPFAANPNLSVSQDIAAQVGSSQVAVCNAQPLRLEVNSQAVQLASGAQIALPGGGSVSRQGNVYVIRDGDGDTVQAEQDSYLGVSYLDTWAGLGRWPTTVSGLLANAANTASGVESESGAVLTAPFQFSDFYPQYGDSWRVTPAQDLLSACGTQFTSGDPTQNYEAGNLPSSEYQTAHAACVSAGVQVPALLDACTLDVAVLGTPAVNIYQTLPTNIIWGMIAGGLSGG
jgi:hypothetical protein